MVNVSGLLRIERRLEIPYINPQCRNILKKRTDGFLLNNPGTLNFVITRICHNYIRDMGLKYITLNEVIGVLECAKQELYRQVAAKYEDQKKIEHGNISELDKEITSGS